MSDDAAPWRRKIDQRLRALLQSTPEAERAQRRVNVLISFSGPVERLQQLGIQIRSVAGNIATATLVLADVERIAGAPEVTFIEVAHPLAPDP